MINRLIPNIWLILEEDVIIFTQNPNITEVTQLEGNILIARWRFKNSEIGLLDTPRLRCNFRNVHKNLLQNGSNTWKLLAYLRSIKETQSGFEYRVHYDNEGLPDGIVWMALNMRKNLLQYGENF